MNYNDIFCNEQANMISVFECGGINNFIFFYENCLRDFGISTFL